MSSNEESPFRPQLVMRRDDLDGLPAVSLPEGYIIRSYEPGDDAAWNRIIWEAFQEDNRERDFERTMRQNEAFQPDRVLFVCKGEETVATASAWNSSRLAPEVGILHYVGTLLAERGRGLGLQVSLACLHKMISEGRRMAVLQTDDFRIPAIKTYLKLGFRPMLVHENQRKRWRDVFEQMGRPYLIERFDGFLSGPPARLYPE